MDCFLPHPLILGTRREFYADLNPIPHGILNKPSHTSIAPPLIS